MSQRTQMSSTLDERLRLVFEDPGSFCSSSEVESHWSWDFSKRRGFSED